MRSMVSWFLAIALGINVLGAVTTKNEHSLTRYTVGMWGVVILSWCLTSRGDD
jgi:hypothetical protein